MKFLDPITGSTLLELRGDGGLQTLFPPSIHPSGERVEWAAYGEPKTIASAELITRARSLAACCLIRRYCGGVTGAAGVFAALDAVDRRVADRIRDWLGLAGATFGAQKSKATYDFFPSLGDPPPYLASLPKRRLDEAALRSPDFAPASASRIADQCRQLAQFRDTKGNIAEPLWYAGLCVLTRCVESERIAHEWSSGHPGYSVAETQKKFAHALRDSGPTTCARFESLNPEGCKNCSRKGLIKSPIVLGRRDDPTTGANNYCNDGRSDRTERATPGREGVNENVEEHGPMNEGVTLEDFYAYMPTHSYIFAPSRELWPASSVNARVRPPSEVGKGKRMSASEWLDQNRPIEQMTWAPGLPMLIPDRLISEGGWIDRSGVSCFNLYRPPTIVPGNAAEAEPWLDHVHKVFGGDADHIVKYLAHRVQRPQEKINHALVFGGAQGIGKDTLLEPVKYAVGPWNFAEVSPQQMLGRFNGFLKSVILRVNEARDLGETNRFSFYDHMKAYTAAPPDVLRVDEKNLREHSSLNCCGVIITTNHKADGIYLPPDDRRHFVAWSDLTKDDFADGYWNTIWDYYARGGYCHVAAYLGELDISSFDPKAPPPKTPAFWDIVDANRAPEEAELADVLEKIGNPDATTIVRITTEAKFDLSQWMSDRKNRRAIPHRLEKCGYVRVRNDAAQDGLWKIDGARQVVYAKSILAIGERLKAARELTK